MLPAGLRDLGRHLGLATCLTVAVAACATEAPPTLGETDQAATVCSTGPTTAGIDVSVYQGTIDWTKVKTAGIEYAFIRVSDGLNSPDSKFAANWAGAKAAGVLRGVYQFFEPGQDAIAQADMMIAKMGTLGADDLSPVIDVEATGGLPPTAVAAKVKAWVDHVKAVTGRLPIIYSGYYFWNGQVGGANDLPSPLWVAAYVKPCPQVPSPWTKWSFWQYSSTGAVSGISGNVDMDTFWGTRADLLATMAATGICGDGACGGGETYGSCPADCPPCGVIAASGGQIDDGDACFFGGGPSQYLRQVSTAGADGDLVWTHATSSATESNFAQWNLVLAQAGRYHVEVYTAAAFAQSKQAKYVIHASGADQTATVDQTAADGWQPLGDFDLAAGGDQWIHLGDNTGEAIAGNVQLVFDAVRLTPLAPTDPNQTGGDAGVGGTHGGNLANGAGGGCAVGGGGAGWLVVVGGVIAAAGRRRRRG
jgi:lysozyme